MCRAHAQPHKRRLWGYYILTPRSGPHKNRMCCGFAWFNVHKALCAGTGACAVHTRSRISGGFGVIIP
ncbi:hypothetical protein DW194_17400 [Subdoligranulum sp. AM16-9]|nr:hypothetical protein DW194_17400 [Subdoligranulum sp. AM16-9]